MEIQGPWPGDIENSKWKCQAENWSRLEHFSTTDNKRIETLRKRNAIDRVSKISIVGKCFFIIYTLTWECEKYENRYIGS